ncbi:MAG: type II toxin-antitoxin system RelE/ParE family toxin [bacterium]|jgi:plasmid stabilization system protein ParE
MKVRFLFTAERELQDAFEWYENQVPGLGAELIVEVDRSVRLVMQYPETCADLGEGIRRMLVNRFPYGVWYAVEGDTIVVYAIAHLHRKPRRYR